MSHHAHSKRWRLVWACLTLVCWLVAAVLSDSSRQAALVSLGLVSAAIGAW